MDFNVISTILQCVSMLAGFGGSIFTQKAAEQKQQEFIRETVKREMYDILKQRGL